MARTHGKDADFVFNAVALEDELNQFSLTFSVPPGEITAFADAWQNFLAGKPTLAISAQGSYDPAASQGDATIFAALGGAALAYDAEPNGTNGYDGYGIVTDYSVTCPVNGPVTYTAGIRHNGGSAAADGAAPTRA